MGQVIPRQHPEVVLRSHFKAVRALLCVALVAIVALATTVVILANDDNDSPAVFDQPAVQQEQTLPPGTRFDGGPDEGTRGPQAQPLPPGTRFDGGPDEGTRGPQSYGGSNYEPAPADGWRSSYEPTPSDGFKDRAGGPRMIPQGPGAR